MKFYHDQIESIGRSQEQFRYRLRAILSWVDPFLHRVAPVSTPSAMKA
ncbi:unnamed protein product, partial [Linum tenue]